MDDNPAELSLSNFLASEGRDPTQAPPSFTRWMQAGAWAVELYEPEMLASAEARTNITYNGKSRSVINTLRLGVNFTRSPMLPIRPP